MSGFPNMMDNFTILYNLRAHRNIY